MKEHYKGEKNRSTAIILAVLFGPFSWIYTWKYDHWKFWLSLILSIILILPTVGFILIIEWFWAVVDSIVKDQRLFKNYFR